LCCGLLGRVTSLVWNSVETAFRSGRLILGDSVRGFEEEYAAYHYIDAQAPTLIVCWHAMVTGLPAVEAG
jgi:hypothetical protein